MEKLENTATWLNRLQKESWNLELLISGFAIFLLVQGQELLEMGQHQLDLHYSHGLLFSTILFFTMIANIACTVLIFNLVVHIFMRGVWIGAIGLRSVQSKRDFSKFNYTEKFTELLEQRVPTLDKLIIGLDNICSVIFGFTFLVVFMFVSLFTYILFSVFLYFTVNKFCQLFRIDEDIINTINLCVSLAYLLGGLLYLFDTLSLGILKKWRWSQRLYYPVYYFFSWITLSRFYRTIYYHFLSRFSKWSIFIAISFFICFFLLSPFFTINAYRFYPDNETTFELFSNYYDNLRPENKRIGKVSIPGRNIKESFLPVFIRYSPEHNENLLQHCDNYEPSKKSDFISGIKFSPKGFAINDPIVEEESSEKLLNCLTQFYTIYLNDSLYRTNDFYFYTQSTELGEKGITAMVDIRSLPVGKNVLRVTRQTLDTAEVWVEKNYSIIPFWKEN